LNNVVDFVLLKILDKMKLILVLTIEMHERLKKNKKYLFD
jgi:hypothetical protein